MAYFIKVECKAHKNKKDKALQKVVEKFDNTTTDMSFADLVLNFQGIVDSANMADKRSKEATMKCYPPMDDYLNASLAISGDNISICLTHIKGYLRHDFAVQLNAQI